MGNRKGGWGAGTRPSSAWPAAGSRGTECQTHLGQCAELVCDAGANKRRVRKVTVARLERGARRRLGHIRVESRRKTQSSWSSQLLSTSERDRASPLLRHRAHSQGPCAGSDCSTSHVTCTPHVVLCGDIAGKRCLSTLAGVAPGGKPNKEE